jgi:hypothetical protein
MEWRFKDPQNTAAFTSKSIVERTDWIQYVSHDEEDGAWQFHSEQGTREEGARVVSLEEVVKLDPSIESLFDLPLGWCAWRKTRDADWHRKKKTVNEKSNSLTPCPCCGSLAISKPGAYEICRVCGWEDDSSQAADPDFGGGANHHSLNEARKLWSNRKNRF